MPVVVACFCMCCNVSLLLNGVCLCLLLFELVVVCCMLEVFAVYWRCLLLLEVLIVVYRILFLRLVAECGCLLLFNVVDYAGFVECCVVVGCGLLLLWCVLCCDLVSLFGVGVLVC